MKGWIEKGCSCAGGMRWSHIHGPVECSSCNGTGRYFIHLKSGVEALYPGGPFLGKLSKSELQGARQ